MKILYAAIDQLVPGTKGGAIHVRAVAEGLARRGHEVHVLTERGGGAFPSGQVHWHAVSAPLHQPQLRWMRAGQVAAIARSIEPEVVIERYHNFGGEGLRAAVQLKALAVLEVNAPVIDYPGSPKQRLDRVLVAEPMRRWRDWQCRTADLFVTPSAAIVPDWVPRDTIVETEWGADTERFKPNQESPPFPRQAGETVAVFAGAFRAWHGAIQLVHAIARLRAKGRSDIRAVLIGDGPELESAKAAAAGHDGITFTGALPHDRMPAWLAAADVGVAPFDMSAHAPLQLGFYWSPLKVFEYMASGLPVVAPASDRLTKLIEHDREGLLYGPSDPSGIDTALERLTDAPLRARLGSAARERAVRDFSWQAHCEKLETAILTALSKRRRSL